MRVVQAAGTTTLAAVRSADSANVTLTLAPIAGAIQVQAQKTDVEDRLDWWFKARNVQEEPIDMSASLRLSTVGYVNLTGRLIHDYDDHAIEIVAEGHNHTASGGDGTESMQLKLLKGFVANVVADVTRGATNRFHIEAELVQEVTAQWKPHLEFDVLSPREPRVYEIGKGFVPLVILADENATAPVTAVIQAHDTDVPCPATAGDEYIIDLDVTADAQPRQAEWSILSWLDGCYTHASLDMGSSHLVEYNVNLKKNGAAFVDLLGRYLQKLDFVVDKNTVLSSVPAFSLTFAAPADLLPTVQASLQGTLSLDLTKITIDGDGLNAISLGRNMWQPHLWVDGLNLDYDGHFTLTGLGWINLYLNLEKGTYTFQNFPMVCTNTVAYSVIFAGLIFAAPAAGADFVLENDAEVVWVVGPPPIGINPALSVSTVTTPHSAARGPLAPRTC